MSQNQEVTRLIPTVGAVVVVVLLVGLLFASFKVVNPSHKGLVIKAGALQNEVVNDGLHFRLPFYTDIVEIFVGNQTTDKYDRKGNFVEESPFRGIQPLSKDGQMLDIDVQINYSITDPVKFRRETGGTDPELIEGLLFVPTIRRLVYDYAAEYGWKALIQEGERQEFGQRIFLGMSEGMTSRRVCSDEKTVKDETTGTEVLVAAGCELIGSDSLASPGDYGVSVTAVNFKKIRPNQAIIAAVEMAQAKEQEVKIAQQEAAISRENANRAIEIKRGETESKKLEADAEAYKLRVEKEQEALGISALAKAERERSLALQASSALVEYKRLEIDMLNAQALVEFGKNSKGDVPNEITIIGTDEARDMNLFFNMAQTVANTQ